MKTVNLTCIGCPLGCQLEVMMDANGDIQLITGNTCPRGEKYARKEVTSPTRIVTSSVRVYGSRKGERMVSVKTASDVPKGKIMEVIRDLAGVSVPCPVRIGDVLLRDIAGTGVDMVATKNVDRIQFTFGVGESYCARGGFSDASVAASPSGVGLPTNSNCVGPITGEMRPLPHI